MGMGAVTETAITEMPSELEDQNWRLNNLYSCREEGTGRALPFVLRDEQRMLLQHFIEKPHVPAYVIKSRRLGISTFTDCFMVDCAAFRQGFHGFLIDQKQEDASRKMIEIVRFALDSLPPEILKDFIMPKRNDSELRLRMNGEEEKHDSVIYATVGGRGGDCSMLHVSEWGPIAATDPARSSEIRSGAFPAARKALRVVETTWYGGKSGDLYDLVKPILDGDPNAEGELYFFPWHGDPQAVKFTGELTPDTEDYFRVLTDKLSKKFSREQKLWYAAKKIEQGHNLFREFPSTISEAMSVPVPGAIYAEEMSELREAKRMCVFPADATVPAYTFHDLGISDYGCVWLIQFVGRDILLLDYYSNEGQGAAHYVQWIRDKEREHKVSVRTVFLPHDADKRAVGTGKTYRSDIVAAGIPDNQIRVVPRTPDIWLGINSVRSLLKRMFIHSVNCARELKTAMGQTIPSGIQCLDFYRKKVTQSTGGGGIFEDPVHDIYSNGADALRTMGEAHRQGMLEGASSTARENRNTPVSVIRARGYEAPTDNRVRKFTGRVFK
jgi:hypothetical protein